jgi:hypothetical protein
VADRLTFETEELNCLLGANATVELLRAHIRLAVNISLMVVVVNVAVEM